MNSKHINFLKSVDPLELMSKIRSFRKLDIKNMEYSEISKAIEEVLTFNGEFIYTTNIQIYPKGTKFFRVRELKGSKIPNENLSFESDFWNAPEKFITKYGRLNKPGESLLYTSPINPQVAIREVKLADNSFYAIIVYEAKADIKVNSIGMEYSYEKLGIDNKQAILINDMINDFLRDEFSREVGNGTEYLYKISEIISKGYFDLPPRVVQDAWAYPSIKDKLSYNVCFRPDIAKDVLELQGALICKYDNTDNINVKCVSNGFNEYGYTNFYELGSPIQKQIFPEISIGS
ncbi:hypothetical protein [Paraclostridium dentum]|uniref:hypothetical protein n=1 Tax=Paraclostridium dentum TaxID=2662455 RepID=UPI00197D22BF|nr:hypothetical protein [Paraclostridium dentum]